MSNWIIILLSVALIAQTVYLLSYKKQIKDIGNQLFFISKHQSFKFILLQLKPKEVYRLVELCNQLLRDQRELSQQFIQKNEEVNATIVSLSHDIRTPLASLGGYLQLAEAEDSLTEKSRYISLAHSRMKRIITLVDELFYYTKLQNSDYHLEMASVDVIDLLQKRLFTVIDDFSLRDSEPDIHMPDFPVYILANRNAVERVFDNLLSNYFLHGSGILTIRCEEQDHDVTFHFTNQLSPEQTIHTDKIFTRFFKEDTSRTSQSSGLGLSIVKTLMEKMNGSVHVNAEDEKFCLSITFIKSDKEYGHE